MSLVGCGSNAHDAVVINMFANIKYHIVFIFSFLFFHFYFFIFQGVRSRTPRTSIKRFAACSFSNRPNSETVWDFDNGRSQVWHDDIV